MNAGSGSGAARVLGWGAHPPRVLMIAPSRSRTFLLFIHPCHPRNP